MSVFNDTTIFKMYQKYPKKFVVLKLKFIVKKKKKLKNSLCKPDFQKNVDGKILH